MSLIGKVECLFTCLLAIHIAVCVNYLCIFLLGGSSFSHGHLRILCIIKKSAFDNMYYRYFSVCHLSFDLNFFYI